MIKIITSALFVFLMLNCVSTNSFVIPNNAIKEYKIVHVERISPDDFNLHTAVVSELSEMGFIVIEKIPSGSNGDPILRATYTCRDSWDLTRYITHFQITLADEKTGQILASASITSNINLASTEEKVRQVFQELGQKINR